LLLSGQVAKVNFHKLKLYNNLLMAKTLWSNYHWNFFKFKYVPTFERIQKFLEKIALQHQRSLVNTFFGLIVHNYVF
jgi:hypothetical protein